MAFCRIIRLHGAKPFSTLTPRCQKFKGGIYFPQKDGQKGHEMTDAAKKPVICILSWTGSRDHDLAKYSAIYEQRGYIVVRSIVDYGTMLSFRSGSLLSQQASQILNLIRDHDLAKEPLLIHLFSNGGFFLYDAITSQLKKEQNKDVRVVGCICDSAPAEETLMRTARLVTTITPGPVAFKYAVGITVSSVLRTALWLRWFARYAGGDRNFENRIWQRMVKEPNTCPQLFLFSKADKLIDYKHIQLFMEERKKLGVRTWQKMWEDSEHVSHFRKYHDSYLAEVLGFLQICQSGLLKK